MEDCCQGEPAICGPLAGLVSAGPCEAKTCS